MNKILREHINPDLTNIIVLYLLPNKQKIDIIYLNRKLRCIKDRLKWGIFYVNFNTTSSTKIITHNNCKITSCQGLKEWTIRPKNY